jgi:hypothetical protein
MKQIGFFKEFRGGDYPSITDLAGKGNRENIRPVLEFLAKGKVHIVSPGIIRDPLVETRPIISAAHILSFEEWMWPKELGYCIERHNVLLPEEFLAYVKNDPKTSGV